MKWPVRLLIAGLLVLTLAGWIAFQLVTPFAGYEREVFVDLPRGTPTHRIAGTLEDAGVIRHAWQFLLVRALHPRQRLQAGEYHFDRPATVWEIFRRISRGDVFYYELPVPEGQSMFDIAASVERLGLLDAGEFLRAARDPSSIRDLAPAAPTLEGYLFPETYRITRRQTAQQICRMMTDRFRKAWHELGSPSDAHSLVTLASLVEKEAAAPAERPTIASVFRNRLKIGMKLDCDPTTVYAALLKGTYRGAIYKSDLDSPHPYNTYQNAGLPPGPIANPGMASLRAAIHPAETKFLYFVLHANGSGRHEFSENMAAHQLAAARYRRAEHANGAKVNHADKGIIKKTQAAGVPGRKKTGHHR